MKARTSGRAAAGILAAAVAIGGLGPDASAGEGASPAEACGRAALADKIVPRWRAGEALDVHHLCVALDTLCPADDVADARRTLDALALVDLGETERARVLLAGIAAGSHDAHARRTADVLLAWSLLRTGNEEAFARRLATLPAEARARLELLAAANDASGPAALLSAAGPEVAHQVEDVRTARHTKRPWLAGALSAVLPGAGQVYAGSWQAAAVSFVLNAALIGATVELGARRLYLPAAASGLAASFFYVGNIMNAADLASRRNDVAAETPFRALETRLVPEAHP